MDATTTEAPLSEFHIVGPLRSEDHAPFLLKLLEATQEETNDPITLYITSEGGEVIIGHAICDVLLASPRPITTVVLGEAASMAAMIFACGDERLMGLSSMLMFHAASGTKNKRFLDLDKQRTVDRLADITGMEPRRCAQLFYNKKDQYFSAKEAFDARIATGIYQRRRA